MRIEIVRKGQCYTTKVERTKREIIQGFIPIGIRTRVVAAGLTDVYTKSEIDSKLEPLNDIWYVTQW